MVKLQKQKSRKVGNKVYSKYVVVIPEDNIKKASFKEGDKLVISAEKGKITIRRKK